MIVRRVAIAVAAAATVVLSAPFAQQVFTEAGTRWPAHFRMIGIGATAGPVGGALLLALGRIRDRRPLRYLALGSSLAIGASYILINALSFAESFHFVEYGLLAWLFYRAWRPSINARGALSEVEGPPLEDGSVLVLPVLAATLVGTLDEWFQWFIPIRVGEARDVLLNGVAVGCGLLFAISLDPPRRLTLVLEPDSRRHVGAWAAAAIFAFALFFQIVHVGHDVVDLEIGSFRSRYTAADLATATRDRVEQWRNRPPLVQRRLSREDQYLTEGLWHAQRRNRAWDSGDLQGAWRENRILEKFYAPILDTPTYAGTSGHRWPSEQRADAAGRAGAHTGPSASDAYPYPLYVWPKAF